MKTQLSSLALIAILSTSVSANNVDAIDTLSSRNIESSDVQAAKIETKKTMETIYPNAKIIVKSAMVNQEAGGIDTVAVAYNGDDKALEAKRYTCQTISANAEKASWSCIDKAVGGMKNSKGAIIGGTSGDWR